VRVLTPPLYGGELLICDELMKMSPPAGSCENVSGPRQAPVDDDALEPPIAKR